MTGEHWCLGRISRWRLDADKGDLLLDDGRVVTCSGLSLVDFYETPHPNQPVQALLAHDGQRAVKVRPQFAPVPPAA